jgi:hypothetical protein
VGKYLFFFILTAILFAASLFGVYVSYQDRAQMENEIIRLNRAINFASDGAVEAALGMDNVNPRDADINPKNLSDTFFSLMLKSYNMSDTLENRLVMYSRTPVMIFVAYDGMYIGRPTFAGGQMDYAWSVKIPWSYVSGGRYYALTLDNENVKSLIPGSSAGFLTGSGPSDYKERIVSKLIDAISMTIYGASDGASLKYFIPSTSTMAQGLQGIDGLALIVIMQNVDFNTRKPLNTFSVSTTQIVELEKIWGHGGYYAFESQWIASGQPFNADTMQIFSSAREAAAAGLLPHPQLYIGR